MKFTYSIVVQRPIEVVFFYLVDFQNCPRWNSKCSAAAMLTEAPIRSGSEFRLMASVLGQNIESSVVIEEFTPTTTFSFVSFQGPVPFRSRYRLEPTELGTRITYEGEMSPQGYFRLVAPLIARRVQREVPGLYATLKKELETKS